jgi:hypothetical protein
MGKFSRRCGVPWRRVPAYRHRRLRQHHRWTRGIVMRIRFSLPTIYLLICASACTTIFRSDGVTPTMTTLASTPMQASSEMKIGDKIILSGILVQVMVDPVTPIPPDFEPVVYLLRNAQGESTRLVPRDKAVSFTGLNSKWVTVTGTITIIEIDDKTGKHRPATVEVGSIAISTQPGTQPSSKNSTSSGHSANAALPHIASCV